MKCRAIAFKNADLRRQCGKFTLEAVTPKEAAALTKLYRTLFPTEPPAEPTHVTIEKMVKAYGATKRG